MESLTTERRESSTTQPLPARKMHSIVLVMVGAFLLIAATYPIGMYRVVRQTEGWGEKAKVKGVYLKTLDEANKPIEATAQK
jgi:hypothetical protein